MFSAVKNSYIFVTGVVLVWKLFLRFLQKITTSLQAGCVGNFDLEQEKQTLKEVMQNKMEEEKQNVKELKRKEWMNETWMEEALSLKREQLTQQRGKQKKKPKQSKFRKGLLFEQKLI